MFIQLENGPFVTGIKNGSIKFDDADPKEKEKSYKNISKKKFATLGAPLSFVEVVRTLSDVILHRYLIKKNENDFFFFPPVDIVNPDRWESFNYLSKLTCFGDPFFFAYIWNRC